MDRKLKRLKLTSGDIFSVKLEKGMIAYLQYIFSDPEYLGGDLIRSFSYKNYISEDVILSEVVRSKILFYTYTSIKIGTKRNIWQKVGNHTIEHEFEPPYFRETIDNYSEVKKSNKWEKFRSGSTQRWHIGELNEETRKLPIAGVLPPEAIVKWIETGWHGFLDPM